MIKLIVFVVGSLFLIFIFIRRYLITEKNTTLKSILFRKKNLFRHSPEINSFELTIDEIIPPKDESDTKKIAKADSLLKKAIIFNDRGDKKSAERLLIQSLALDPSSIKTYERLGMIYLHQNQYGKAEIIYKKLTASIIDDPIYYSNLGLAFFSQKKFDDAKSSYVKSLELDDTRAGRFFSLAQVLNELEEYEDALKNYLKALDMDPDNLDYLLTIAHFYIDREMISDAKQLLSEILLLFPDNVDAQSMLQNI